MSNKILLIFGKNNIKDSKSSVFTFGWLDGLSGKYRDLQFVCSWLIFYNRRLWSKSWDFKNSIIKSKSNSLFNISVDLNVLRYQEHVDLRMSHFETLLLRLRTQELLSLKEKTSVLLLSWISAHTSNKGFLMLNAHSNLSAFLLSLVVVLAQPVLLGGWVPNCSDSTCCWCHLRLSR